MPAARNAVLMRKVNEIAPQFDRWNEIIHH
jgi:hypothetical protein